MHSGNNEAKSAKYKKCVDHDYLILSVLCCGFAYRRYPRVNPWQDNVCWRGEKYRALLFEIEGLTPRLFWCGDWCLCYDCVCCDTLVALSGSVSVSYCILFVWLSNVCTDSLLLKAELY